MKKKVEKCIFHILELRKNQEINKKKIQMRTGSEEACIHNQAENENNPRN